MAVQEQVTPDHIRDIVEAAAHRNTPIALTCRSNDSWQNYRGRFLGLREGQAWIESGTPSRGQASPELVVGCRVGVAFKQRHYKYVYSTEITAVTDFQMGPDVKIRGLGIAWPDDMRQLQRRLFKRVTVPDDRPVFAQFWEGGLAHEPQDALRQKLTYTGQVLDLSAGGFRLRMFGGDPGFQCGTAIGAEIKTDGMGRSIKVDAQFRHAVSDEFGVMLGMQLMGLGETNEGRETLDHIARLCRDLLPGRRRRSRVPAAG